MQLHWSRGLFRLWVVFAALWTLGMGAIVIATMADGTAAPLPREILGAVAVVVIPPLAALILGASLAWAFRGFRA